MNTTRKRANKIRSTQAIAIIGKAHAVKAKPLNGRNDAGAARLGRHASGNVNLFLERHLRDKVASLVESDCPLAQASHVGYMNKCTPLATGKEETSRHKRKLTSRIHWRRVAVEVRLAGNGIIGGSSSSKRISKQTSRGRQEYRLRDHHDRAFVS